MKQLALDKLRKYRIKDKFLQAKYTYVIMVMSEIVSDQADIWESILSQDIEFVVLALMTPLVPNISAPVLEQIYELCR